MALVLFVEDDPSLSRMTARVLRHAGYETHLAATGHQALSALHRLRPDVAPVDLRLPDMSGIDVVEHLRLRHGAVPSVVITAIPDYAEATRALNIGIWAWLRKPVDNDKLLLALSRALSGDRPDPAPSPPRQGALTTEAEFDGMVGRSPAMLGVYEQISKLAPLHWSVLIEGETGTGKELAARSLHGRSRRRDGPFVPVHVGAIPETLFEANLFGHEAGAFTDAREAAPGWFEKAQGGTLFLDEIGEVPLPAQAKLLRALEERQVVRVGGRRFIAVDVRVVAATNIDMNQAIEAGRFRRDLYHRFEATLRLPSLAERADDIDALIDYLLPRLAAEAGVSWTLSDEDRIALRRRSWPGNVRERQRVLRHRLIEVGHHRDRPQRDDSGGSREPGPVESESAGPAEDTSDLNLPAALARLEADLIGRALSRTKGNRWAAARLLRIDPKTLWRKLPRRR